MEVFDDRHFRFSSIFHGLDWQSIAKSCNPSLSKERVDYLLSLAGAFSLNPLLLITTTIVHYELKMSPPELGYFEFSHDLKQIAQNLIRSNVEDDTHPKYNRALASIWDMFKHNDRKVHEFLDVYDQLYTKHKLSMTRLFSTGKLGWSTTFTR